MVVGMECNKDEAERAKEIAAKKFKLKEYDGAKKFALKAQSLYPEIEGVTQMLATLEVYIAAENRVNGDVNWYGILNASPGDNEETLKRKYRKLALMLHPDKNREVGADGAFKHVSEAWKFLSDKEKRAGYDRKRSLQTVYQKVSVSTSNNGFCNFGAKAGFGSNVRTSFTQKSNPMTEKVNLSKPAGNTQKASRPDHLRTTPSSFTAPRSAVKLTPDTFWTICRRCSLQYEYLRIYVNCNMLCPNCRQSYSAVEGPKPGVSRCWSRCSSKTGANQNTTSGGFNNSKWTFSRASSAAHAASVVQQAYEKVKKEREDAKATERREKKNAKRKSTIELSPARVKRRVIGEESEAGCSSGSKVTYYVTGETGKNMGKLDETEEIVEKSSPEIRK